MPPPKKSPPRRGARRVGWVDPRHPLITSQRSHHRWVSIVGILLAMSAQLDVAGSSTDYPPRLSGTPPRRGFSDRTNVMCFGLAGTLEVQQSR